MRIYYLDEALSDEELDFVKNALVRQKGIKGAEDIEQVRVPMAFSVPPVDGKPELPVGEQIRLLRSNLLRVGIANDFGQQSMVVMPKEMHWGLKVQMAMLELTGFAPCVVQRLSHGGLVRSGNIRVIDGQGVLCYSRV